MHMTACALKSICCAAEDELPGEPYVLYMSTLNEEGVMAVKQTCCDRLLASRVEQKLQVRWTCTSELRAC